MCCLSRCSRCVLAGYSGSVATTMLNVRVSSREALPWLLLVAGLALPPVFTSQSWLLAYLAQTATMIVFALSFNLLLGETGLLSFGHAVYAGLGAFSAAQFFNRFAVPLRCCCWSVVLLRRSWVACLGSSRHVVPARPSQ